MPSDDMLHLLAQSVGHLSDAVLITQGERGPDGVRRIIFVNPAFTAMTGFTAEEAVGATPDITIGPDSDVAALEKIQAARAKLVPVRVELLKYRKDRSTFWAELDVVPVLDKENRPTHFLGVMRDVTDRRQAESRLVEADRLAAIGTLAAGIAHEINNPLAFIVMNLDYIARELREAAGQASASAGGLPPRWSDVEAALADARSGVQRVAKIVRDIRVFSRRDPAVVGPVDLAPLLDSAIQIAWAGISTPARVVRRYENVSPVLGSASRLSQVFLNLVVNALQSIAPEHAGERIVEVSAHEVGPEVVVEVRDQGAGIPADALPHIFEPFFTTKQFGKGMGLSISYGIVISLGGRMTIESAIGQGTLVRVFLPRGESPPGFTPEAVSGSQRLRILIVDDEPFFVSALRRALSARHDVTACSSGTEALELFANDRDFDAVLCDLMMPKVSGADVYRAVRERWPGFEKRFVIMSGGAFTDDARSFLDALQTPCLHKPINESDLDRTVREVARAR